MKDLRTSLTTNYIYRQKTYGYQTALRYYEK